MKKIVILLFSLFVLSCTEVPEVEIRTSTNVPFHILLSNSTGDIVGMGVPIQDQVFVTADHLLEHHKILQWQSVPLEIVARDFDNDLLYFRLPTWRGIYPQWSTSPPAVGSEIFWMDGSRLTEQKVHSVSNITEDQIDKDVITISGVSNLGNSGSPVFDAEGKIFGILVGGDKSEELSYVVRSDMILEILEENMED
ncbi:serine protease [Candidatus Gracilibacteria bacterium]|nr:serine protease [Candidatus Gracilibacteria bacterium]MCF7819671.1 serine protease [Candidatus Gracilibacteria bacterium]